MRTEGGCHCGAVRFAIETARQVDLLDCNCSICAKTGYLHLIVEEASFTPISGNEALVEYRFGTRTAAHFFCGVCGIKPFYRPRSHPGAWSVNFRCLDHGHGLAAQTSTFDGRNWEAAREELGRAEVIDRAR